MFFCIEYRCFFLGGGVFGDSFCQRVQCMTCFCVSAKHKQHPAGCLIPARSLHRKVKIHLSCYHSTMTEHKVIPVQEFKIPLCHVHKNDFILHFSSPFLSLIPLMSCMTAGFYICLLSRWSDASRVVLSVVSVLLQEDCL